jgi:hypothetical protein
MAVLVSFLVTTFKTCDGFSLDVNQLVEVKCRAFDIISIVFVSSVCFRGQQTCRIPNLEYDRFYTAIKKIQKHDSTKQVVERTCIK